VLQVWFSIPQDSTRKVDGKSQLDGPVNPSPVGEKAQHMDLYRVCHIQPLMDKRMLHEHSVPEAVAEKRCGSPLRGVPMA